MNRTDPSLSDKEAETSKGTIFGHRSSSQPNGGNSNTYAPTSPCSLSLGASVRAADVEKQDSHQNAVGNSCDDQPLDLTVGNRICESKNANGRRKSINESNGRPNCNTARSPEGLHGESHQGMRDNLTMSRGTSVSAADEYKKLPTSSVTHTDNVRLSQTLPYAPSMWHLSSFWMPLGRKLLFPGLYPSFASQVNLPASQLPATLEPGSTPQPQHPETRESGNTRNRFEFRHLPSMLDALLKTQNTRFGRKEANGALDSTFPRNKTEVQEQNEATAYAQVSSSGGSPRPQPISFKPCRLPCDVCGRTYATIGALAKHVKTHEDPNSGNRFNCKICKKECSSLGALRMHIRTHTLPCECHICGKAFSRTWLLQGHIRTHTGEKPYQCSVCSRAFADRSNLRAHMQTHETVKRYSCAPCGKTFSRISLLKRHKIHCEAAKPQSQC